MPAAVVIQRPELDRPPRDCPALQCIFFFDLVNLLKNFMSTIPTLGGSAIHNKLSSSLQSPDTIPKPPARAREALSKHRAKSCLRTEEPITKSRGWIFCSFARGNILQSPQNHSFYWKKCRRAINGWLENILKKPQLTAVIGRPYFSFEEKK